MTARRPDPPLSKAGMCRAARLLAEYAGDIFVRHTRYVRGEIQWARYDSKNEAEECLRLSRQLWAKARQR